MNRAVAGMSGFFRGPGLKRVALLGLVALSLPSSARPGVKFGDAVPGIIRPSDLERIKMVLRLDRFSVIAAVWLGAVDGREAIVAEPLTDSALSRVKESCETGGFCPDPVGFVASRVRVVVLRDKDVESEFVIQQEARDAHGRLVDLKELGVEGAIIGWSGRAEASDGHVALSLTPITERPDGTAGAGLDPPLLIRFNPDRERFQVYDCVAEDGGRAVCGFRDGPGD